MLSAGEDWWERIGDLIRGSECFLFILTPDSIRSPACIRELELAQSWGKRVLPLVRVQPSDLEILQLTEVLATKQWVFIRAEDD